MASSSKRPVPKPTMPHPTASSSKKKLSIRPVDTLDLDAVHHIHFDRALREVGNVSQDSAALFLPASPEECSLLVNHWKHLPNSASPAFSLPRYTHPEEVNFKEVLEQDTNDLRPDTFYPSPLTTFCTTFAHGPVCSGEAFQLYQALAFLQRGFARIIRGHLAKTEIHRRLIAFTNLPNFSHSLQYYQLIWHGAQNCPLVAPLLVLLICEFCEEHLSEEEYAERVYDQRLRDGPGMSVKTRDRLLEDITEFFDLHELAIPIPFDPTTREGQLMLTVVQQGSRVDQITHPVSKKVLRPDPSFALSPSNKSTAVPATKARLRPPSPDFDAPATPAASSFPSSAHKFSRTLPTQSSVIDVDAEEDGASPDLFKGPSKPDVLVIRQSIARVAKTKPKIPEEFRRVPTPVPSAKRERSPVEVPPFTAVSEPPAKKRRTQKAAGKARVGSRVSSPDAPSSAKGDEPFRIQEGEPDYLDGDDTNTTAHARFLTNPRFTIKTPFSQLISKAVDSNKRGAKIPFLRAPKWKVSEEMKKFGAFATIGDTTFSLQGLSRFGYASSRFLWPTNSRTLPSPEALYSTNNCVTCISRGEVCEASDKQGGACRQCNGMHRSCPSCLSLEEHKDRFLAIHNHIRGYPAGYSASLDLYATALDRITKLQNSFAPLFEEAQQALLHSMQTVRDSSFDLNVVLSRWADDNPNLPLDYDTLTWLATLFGWNSACNLTDYLSNPEDLPRLEEFMREHLPPSPASVDQPLVVVPRASKPASQSSPGKLIPVLDSPELKSRRRPAAGVPINFSSTSAFRAPSSSAPPLSATIPDEEMDVEGGPASSAAVQELRADPEADEEDGEVDGDNDIVDGDE
ncbi:hypothetical protein F5880DRAFT_1619004 [Lentinula raphanica]|nr:hypothetical protein F5880DRAFT_1619004 [Lentinula raphanica]